MSPTLDPEKHLSELTLMYTNAGAKFSGPSNSALFMPVYTAETANPTIDTPAHAPSASQDSTSLYESMGSPSQWPDASPEPYSPVSDDAAGTIYWYQQLPEAAKEPEVAPAAAAAVNFTMAAAIAACSASAAELSKAAAVCTAAAAAISAAGALAGNACSTAATAILAAGIPSANACSAAADACAAAAAADSSNTGWLTAGASVAPSASAVEEKVGVLPSPKFPPFLPVGGGLEAGNQTGAVEPFTPQESTRSTRSTGGRFMKVQAPYEQAGTRSLRSASAAAEKFETPGSQTGARSLRSANAMPGNFETPGAQSGTRTPGSNSKDPNPKPADKDLASKTAGKNITPGSSRKGSQAANIGYNLRSVKESYNLRTAKKDGTPKSSAGKRNTRSAVNKHVRKPAARVRKSV